MMELDEQMLRRLIVDLNRICDVDEEYLAAGVAAEILEYLIEEAGEPVWQ